MQKHAKQLNCDVNSQKFKDVMRYLWMPRLMERIGGGSRGFGAAAAANPVASAPTEPVQPAAPVVYDHVKLSPDNSSMDRSSSTDSSAVTHLSSTPVSDVMDYCILEASNINGVHGGEFPTGEVVGDALESLLSPCGYLDLGFPDFGQNGWGADGDFSSENLWSDDDFWFLQQQLQ